MKKTIITNKTSKLISILFLLGIKTEESDLGNFHNFLLFLNKNQETKKLIASLGVFIFKGRCRKYLIETFGLNKKAIFYGKEILKPQIILETNWALEYLLSETNNNYHFAEQLFSMKPHFLLNKINFKWKGDEQRSSWNPCTCFSIKDICDNLIELCYNGEFEFQEENSTGNVIINGANGCGQFDFYSQPFFPCFFNDFFLKKQTPDSIPGFFIKNRPSLLMAKKLLNKNPDYGLSLLCAGGRYLRILSPETLEGFEYLCYTKFPYKGEALNEDSLIQIVQYGETSDWSLKAYVIKRFLEEKINIYPKFIEHFIFSNSLQENNNVFSKQKTLYFYLQYLKLQNEKEDYNFLEDFIKKSSLEQISLIPSSYLIMSKEILNKILKIKNIYNQQEKALKLRSILVNNKKTHIASEGVFWFF